MAGSLEFIKSASGTSVSSLSVTDCFSDKYDVYKITSTNWNNPSGNSDCKVRLIDSGGSVISDTEYDHARLNLRAYTGFTEVRETGVGYMGFAHYTQSGQTYSSGFEFFVFNPNDSSSYTFLLNQGGSQFNTSGLIGFKGLAVHKSAEQITGFHLFSSQGATQDIQISVYGVK